MPVTKKDRISLEKQVSDLESQVTLLQRQLKTARAAIQSLESRLLRQQDEEDDFLAYHEPQEADTPGSNWE